jgi:hypothetical protein
MEFKSSIIKKIQNAKFCVSLKKIECNQKMLSLHSSITDQRPKSNVYYYNKTLLLIWKHSHIVSLHI